MSDKHLLTNIFDKKNIPGSLSISAGPVQVALSWRRLLQQLKAKQSTSVITSASASMEPPKKRKFFSDNLEKGVSVGHGVALDQVQFEASVPSKQDIPVFSAALLEQQNVVNSSVGGGEVTAARRNRRKYSVDFKVDR